MKQKKALQDMFLMLFFIIFAAVMMLVIIPGQIKVTAIMEKEVMSPRTVPYLACGGILVMGVIGFVSSLATWLKERAANREVQQTAQDAKPRLDTLFPYAVFLLIVLYGVLFKLFGIVIASLIVPAALLFFLRCRKWYMYAILYAFFGIMYTLFTVVLNVPIK